MMRKDTLKTSVFAIASSGLLFLSATAFDAAAGAPIEPVEEASNFLSVPAIFADGYGITGLEIEGDHNSGLPEAIDSDYWQKPYCYQGVDYYLQAEPTNSWQADWIVASDDVDVTVDWSDEVISKQWNDKAVIPVSISLTKGITLGSMKGYEMTLLPAGLLPVECSETTSGFVTLEEESEEEVGLYGTTPASYDTYLYDTATVFTVGAKLTIQQLVVDATTGEPVTDAAGNYVPVTDTEGNAVYILDSPVTTSFENLGKPDWLAPAIDVEGRIIYLFNWNLAAKQFGPDEDRSGWYLLTFSIADKVTYTLTKGYGVEDRGEYTVTTNVSLDAVEEGDIIDNDYIRVDSNIYRVEPTSEEPIGFTYVRAVMRVSHLETGE